MNICNISTASTCGTVLHYKKNCIKIVAVSFIVFFGSVSCGARFLCHEEGADYPAHIY